MRSLRLYGFSAAVIAVLYALNRTVWIPSTTGTLHRLLAWHFHDALAGVLMVVVLETLLTVFHLPPLRNLGWLSLYLLLCGCFWEFVTPLYLSRSVPDVKDIAACWTGGFLYSLLLRRFLSRT